MNIPDEPEDEITRAYRSASEPDAGRPAPSTRAAILAEARAANLRRTPAANDSRYVWRAVAGVAVFGVAVLLWKQADQHVSSDLTVAEPAASADAAATTKRDDVALDAPPATKAETEEVRPAAPALAARESKRAEESAGEAIASVAEPAANSLARARAAAAQSQAAGAIRQEAAQYQELLQREFPEVWGGDRAANAVWVIMDAEGKVATKGVLSDAQTLASVATGQVTWNLVQVRTASGSSLRLAVANVD